MNEAIFCQDLRRVFSSRSLRGGVKRITALDGIDLAVPRGSVFGLLGPNGAGKTTTVRILSTLLTPSGGIARVLGLDAERQAREVRGRIGLVLGGERGLYGRLTARQNLEYFAALNHIAPRAASRRIDELLETMGLYERRNDAAEGFSRGMKQRLHLARGLLTDPEVVFLDEPTTGLDPLMAREIRALVPGLAAAGKTVLLTTHYMFEADALCDDVALINQGRIVARGSPSEIKRQVSGFGILELLVSRPESSLVESIRCLPGVAAVACATEGALHRITIQAPDPARLRPAVLGLIDNACLQGLVEREPTLEEAYVSILG